MNNDIKHRDAELTEQELDQAAGGYYRYELKNVRVTSYNVSGAGQDSAVPSESFSLNYEEVKVTY